MRILHIVDSLEKGGLERFVCNLSIEQRKSGLNPQVFSILPSDGFLHLLKASDIPVTQGTSPSAGRLSSLRLLRKNIAKFRPQAIHTHGYVPNFYTALAEFPGLRRTPRIVTIHDMASRLDGAKLARKFRWSLRSTGQVVAVSNGVCTELNQRKLVAKSPTTVVYNGVSTAAFAQAAGARQQMRGQLNLLSDTTVIGTVGRLVPVKNQAALIQSMPSLIQLAPNTIHLVIAGSGPLENELQQLTNQLQLQQNVTFTGEIDHVAELLSALDIFALPSHSEGMPMSLLEAGAAGLPSVATRVGGNPEVIKHDQTGLIVPAKDQSALQSALSELILQPEKAKAMGQNAQNWVQENGSISASVQQYLALYDQAGR